MNYGLCSLCSILVQALQIISFPTCVLLRVTQQTLAISNKSHPKDDCPSAYPSCSHSSSKADVQCAPVQFQVRLDRLARTAAVHPKLSALLKIVRAHFGQRQWAAPAQDDTEVSRAIIFTNLRETVTSICQALRQQEPLIQARSVTPRACNLSSVSTAHNTVLKAPFAAVSFLQSSAEAVCSCSSCSVSSFRYQGLRRLLTYSRSSSAARQI
jgi:hypothetical protein